MRDIYALLSGCGFLLAAGGVGALYPGPGGYALMLLLAAVGLAMLLSLDWSYEAEIEELRHCEERSDEAIHPCGLARAGLLRSGEIAEGDFRRARNDGLCNDGENA